MLRAISDALLNPGQWVEFVDHAEKRAIFASSFERHLSDICEKTGLHRMHMRRRGGSVFVLSDPSGKLQCGHSVPARRLPDLPE